MPRVTRDPVEPVTAPSVLAGLDPATHRATGTVILNVDRRVEPGDDGILGGDPS
jgi:hypothetical protein